MVEEQKNTARKNETEPRVSGWEAAGIMTAMLLVIGVSLLYLDAQPHSAVFSAIVLLVIYNMVKRQPWKLIEEGIVKGVRTGILPVIIFMLIGVLIAAWMQAGTIPTLIAFSFEVISTEYFLPSVFVVTAVVGMAVGSSFTTASTIGIAFMALAGILGMDLAMTAGAVVSGALLGDKMSPLSDTTNLASSVTKTDLFEHIRHMMWTAIPAFIISLVLFFIIGRAQGTAQTSEVNEWIGAMSEATHVHWIALIPAAVMAVLAIRKTPAIPTMLAGIGAGFVMAVIQDGQLNMGHWMVLIQDGFTASTGNGDIDELLTRGGIQGMMWAVSILVLALAMGGILSSLRIIETLFDRIQSWVNTRGKVVLSTTLSAIGINVSMGEQYMSVVLTGEAYAKQFRKLGLKGRHLSKTLEAGGTVINPLIPYGVSGVFMTSVLGVPVLSFLPFAFFCLICPIITIIYGFTGISMNDGGGPAEAQSEEKGDSEEKVQQYA
ncbi:Na+/H+ antiporter NhaC [Alteribacter natronophilus]|uniref:Na+/H+ antiporter NhaC n=1 Tax=Alteribacter natronophilus TaxID=2583810 RepID=UPI00110E5E58|nr:Na+/H+ antiporter NhaC [Alteribacter natronophilus]TMW70663.1 Na+/H+ antiporter NhaC [Alteribacter natronophilus]